MALTRVRNRMTAGVPASVLDFNDAAGDGATDARAAVVAAMATGVYHFPPGTYRITANLTLTGSFSFSPGAVIRPASGVTVTVAGLILAERHRIFDTSGGGTIVAATGTERPVTHAYPEWWGAAPGVAGASAHIQAAIDFLQNANGGTVYLNGWYVCSEILFVRSRVRIEGQGPVYGTGLITGGGIGKSTTLDFSTAPSGTGAFLVQNGNVDISGFEIVNVGIFRNPPEPKTALSVGLHLVATQHFRVVHCMIFGFAIGCQLNDNVNPNATMASSDGVFDHCFIGGGGRNCLILGGCAGISFRDCVISSGEPNLDAFVLVGRGIAGMKADTITFIDCRIIYLSSNAAGKPASLIRITDGMWINFIRTDIEGAAAEGILVQRDATASHQDIGLKTIDVSNCWFDGCKRCVVFSGFRASGRIENCRLENVFSGSPGTSVIAVEYTTLVDSDILIRGNNIRSSGATGGIVVGNASGVRITENYIYTADVGIAAPGIVLAANATSTIVTSNRVRSNHASPISNGGSGNNVADNIVTTV
jgi:Right handed beta helix region